MERGENPLDSRRFYLVGGALQTTGLLSGPELIQTAWKSHGGGGTPPMGAHPTLKGGEPSQHRVNPLKGNLPSANSDLEALLLTAGDPPPPSCHANSRTRCFQDTKL